jgi:predicted DNA-binding protein
MRNFNMKITEELHKRLRIVCAHQGKEMSELVRQLIEEYVEKAEKKLKLKN